METLIHPVQKLSNESQDSCLAKAGDRSKRYFKQVFLWSSIQTLRLYIQNYVAQLNRSWLFRS